MKEPPRGRPWLIHEVANCFGVMREDVLLWAIFGGLPSHQDEWGGDWYLDIDIAAYAQLPNLRWVPEEHPTLPLPWPSTGWVPAAGWYDKDPFAGSDGSMLLAELTGGPLDGHRVQVPRDAWTMDRGWLELRWWFGEPDTDTLARYVPGRWRGEDTLMFDGYVEPVLDPSGIA